MPTQLDQTDFHGAPKAKDLIAPVQSGGFSLLDPSRFHLSHSYSISYFSGSGYSGSVGLYMGTLEYQLSRPLTLRVGLGYLHQPLGFSSSSQVLGGDQVLPSFRLDFRPSDAFHFMVDYRTIPSTLYNYRSGWRRYSPGSGPAGYLWDW
jgi:hypothetical protein